MRSIQYHVAITSSGLIAGPGGAVDCFNLTPHGEHIDDYLASLRAYDTILMGRGTYEFGLKLGVSDPYPWARCLVFSRTLPPDPTGKVQILAVDPVPVVRALREEDGDPIYLCGGGALASTLLNAGLVDELILKVNPVLLGAGIGLAPDLVGARPLTLRAVKAYDSGVVRLSYAVGEAPPLTG
ncbi:dihydrofolate reductase family protein [Myxococcota bacterium]|nr:dihydrofolate reductase family protein [Myxococcota bacterium]